MTFNKSEIFAIPNLLSYFRILLLPLYVWLFLKADSPRDYFGAALVIVLSGLTDLFDGKIARHFHAITELGKFVDPLADKLTLFTISVCLMYRIPEVSILAIAILIKELYMAGMSAYHYKRGRKLEGALMISKVCTTTLFVAFILLMLFPMFPKGFIYGLITFEVLMIGATLWHYQKSFKALGKNK